MIKFKNLKDFAIKIKDEVIKDVKQGLGATVLKSIGAIAVLDFWCICTFVLIAVAMAFLSAIDVTSGFLHGFSLFVAGMVSVLAVGTTVLFAAVHGYHTFCHCKEVIEAKNVTHSVLQVMLMCLGVQVIMLVWFLSAIGITVLGAHVLELVSEYVVHLPKWVHILAAITEYSMFITDCIWVVALMGVLAVKVIISAKR